MPFFNALQPDTGRIIMIADNPDSSARGNPEGTESYEQAQKCGMHDTFHCFPCFGHIFPYTISRTESHFAMIFGAQHEDSSNRP